MFDDLRDSALFDDELDSILREAEKERKQQQQTEPQSTRKMLAKLLDKLIRSVQLDISNILIRFEASSPATSSHDASATPSDVIVLRVDRIQFKDAPNAEAARSPPPAFQPGPSDSHDNVIVDSKVISVEQVKLQVFTEEKDGSKHVRRSQSSSIQTSSTVSDDADNLLADRLETPCVLFCPSPSNPASLDGRGSSSSSSNSASDSIRVSLVRTQQAGSKSVDCDIVVHDLHAAISPAQVESVLRIFRSAKSKRKSSSVKVERAPTLLAPAPVPSAPSPPSIAPIIALSGDSLEEFAPADDSDSDDELGTPRSEASDPPASEDLDEYGTATDDEEEEAASSQQQAQTVEKVVPAVLSQAPPRPPVAATPAPRLHSRPVVKLKITMESFRASFVRSGPAFTAASILDPASSGSEFYMLSVRNVLTAVEITKESSSAHVRVGSVALSEGVADASNVPLLQLTPSSGGDAAALPLALSMSITSLRRPSSHVPSSLASVSLEQTQSRIAKRVSAELGDITINGDLSTFLRASDFAAVFSQATAAGSSIPSPIAPLKADVVHPETYQGDDLFSEIHVRAHTAELNLFFVTTELVRRPESVVIRVQSPGFHCQTLLSSPSLSPSDQSIHYKINFDQVSGYLLSFRGQKRQSGKIFEIHLQSTQDGVADAVLIQLSSQSSIDEQMLAQTGLPEFSTQGKMPVDKSESPPRLLELYEFRKKNLSPFSPTISVFEGEEQPPTSLDGAEYASFKNLSKTRAHVFVQVILPYSIIELSKENYLSLMSLLETAPPPAAVVEPAGSLPIRRRVAVEVHFRHGQVVLRESKPASERHAYELEFEGLEVFTAFSDGDEPSYTCVRGESFILADKYPSKHGPNGADVRVKVLSQLPMFRPGETRAAQMLKVTISSTPTQLHGDRGVSRRQLIEIAGLEVSHVKGCNWVTGLVDFFSRDGSPEYRGPPVVEDFAVRFSDTTLRYTSTSPSCGSSVVLTVAGIDVRNRGSFPPPATSSWKVTAKGLKLSLIEDQTCIKDVTEIHKQSDLPRYWRLRGFQPVASLDFLLVNVERSLERSSSLFQITNNEVLIDCTADALKTAMEIFRDWTSDPTTPANGPASVPEAAAPAEANPAESPSEEYIVLRLEPEGPVVDGSEDEQLPRTTWLTPGSEILFDPNYLLNLPPVAEDIELPTSFGKVESVFNVDFRLRLHLRPGLVWHDVGDPRSTYYDPEQESVELLLDSVSVKVSFDAASQMQMRLSIKDVVMFDRLARSNWDKVLCFNSIYERRFRPMVEVVLDRLAFPTAPEVRFLLRVNLLPLKINLDHNVYIFLREYAAIALSSAGSPKAAGASSSGSSMFFERIDLGVVRLLLDYKPLTIDQTTRITDIFNVIHIEKAALEFIKLRLQSVPSVPAALDAVISAWKPQALRALPGAFRSIRGINYFSSFGSALSDLVLIPYADYQRGGASALFPSLVRAGSSALSKATKEIINVAAVTSTVIHGVAERGERLLAEESALGTSPPSKFANQPANLSEGLRQGYESVSRELREARDAIVVVPLEEYNRNGAQGLVSRMVRAVPIAVLKPVIGASKGVSKVLLGARNQLDQTEKILSDDKYRSSSS